MAAQAIMGTQGIPTRPATGVANAGWHVAVTRDAAALAALVPQWEDLAAHALEPNPFYESWSLLPALEAEHSARELLFVQVWKQGRLDGLFPFVREPRFKGLPLSALRSWHHASHMLCTPLVRAGAQAACLQALLGWLREDGGGARGGGFRCLPAEGAFIGALADATRDAPVTVASTDHFTRALLRRQSDVERSLAETLSSDASQDSAAGSGGCASAATCRAWRSSRARMPRPGSRNSSPSRRAAGKVAAAARWPRRPATSATPAPCSPKRTRRGGLQIVGIDCAGRPVSRCCNLIASEGSYAWRTAYDERYAEYSPGVMAGAGEHPCIPRAARRVVDGLDHRSGQCHAQPAVAAPADDAVRARWAPLPGRDVRSDVADDALGGAPR